MIVSTHPLFNKTMSTNQTKSLQLLADGFAQDFVNTVLADEAFIDLLQTIAYDFISENIPLTDDDLKYELGVLLLERTTLNSRRV